MATGVGSWIYRHRRLAKQWLAASARVLPAPLSRRLRAAAEQVAYRVVPAYQGETLPPIFSYWASRHVAPLVAQAGFTTPEALYFDEAVLVAGQRGAVRVASIGAGGCALELALAARLRGQGIEATLVCVDFNAALMRSAAAEAARQGLGSAMEFKVLDCNRPFALEPVDVLVVNQFFHHVESLETFCASLRASLAPHGVLATSDVVGRNGHVPWPDVDALVQQHWSRLPPAQRYDRYHDAVRDRYEAVDHAAYSNEGVRAQDVVACLLADFDFERFACFGAAIMPFVERRAGFNFDPALEADRDFIDALATVDAAHVAAGDYPASNMVAVLRHRGAVDARSCVPVTPEAHVEATRRQLSRC